MELKPKKILIPLILGLVIWIIAFFVIGWTQISEDPAIQALYIPMVILFGLGTIILVIVFLFWYLPYLGIDLEQAWLEESLFFGIIIMCMQFILDIIVFTLMQVDLLIYFFGLFLGNPDGSTVIIMYPLILVWAILGGFVTMRIKT
ncbi:MAG: hypothetical protein JSW11_05795 [Candidatus Heimdallarchaeota archaeon]|nr:MAG: hypothetical protein JSW11_05795 [Candidatus Heimdallarchaeota archaeon]